MRLGGIVAVGILLCVCRVAVAEDSGVSDEGIQFIDHIRCAGYADLSVPPLKRARVEGHDLQSDKALDAHMSHAITLGVVIMENRGGRFPGSVYPTRLGGSAEAGIGAFFSERTSAEHRRYEIEHGSPEDFVSARDLPSADIDGRFSALAEWYSARRTQYIAIYSASQCAKLLES